MKVIQHYHQAIENNIPRFSYEIIPPARGKSLDQIIKIIEQLAPFDPPFIDVTAHAATVEYREQADGTIVKKKIRKRPGTIGICGAIQNRFGIDTVAHLLCQGFTQEETEDALIELGFLGIHNILALQGDTPNFVKPQHSNVHTYAHELVSQIKAVNQGKFLDDYEIDSTLDFCIGVAGYPEKHFAAPNLKTDLQYLKEKVEAGAEYITTQMFFDNQAFFSFRKQLQAEGISIPLIPGIKVITSVKQLSSIPQKFHINIPNELVSEIMDNPDQVKEIGQRWAIRQCQELISNGVPLIHFYVMNNPQTVTSVVRELQK
jgi:methylenetetrahydrofolate reductase (NADPH)